MWIVYAVAAAVLWGMSYAASGRILERGMSPLAFFVCYGVVAVVTGFLALAFLGRLSQFPTEIRAVGSDAGWLALATLGSAAGALLIYMAIGEKNPTLASLIEISYPLFVALFAWIFFGQNQLNWPTAIGGAMILGGVCVVYLGNRH